MPTRLKRIPESLAFLTVATAFSSEYCGSEAGRDRRT
jgi:hypothetical protein